MVQSHTSDTDLIDMLKKKCKAHSNEVYWTSPVTALCCPNGKHPSGRHCLKWNNQKKIHILTIRSSHQWGKKRFCLS